MASGSGSESSDTELSYKCDICDKAFKQGFALNRHRLIHTGEKLHKCDKCDRSFTKKSNLETHISCVHRKLKPYRCEHDSCQNKSFSCKADLKRHKLTHTGEKPLRQVLVFLFSNYQRHLITHMHLGTKKKKKYKCSVCQK